MGAGAARLVLASGSPQRREILSRLELVFEYVVPAVEEVTAGDGPAVALENARRKARKVAGSRPGAVVIGCDTVVALEDHLLGKPADAQAARRSLLALSGRQHSVLSGLCVIRDGKEKHSIVSTRVVFRALDPSVIDWYIATEEWRERAGGYAIQGRGGALVARVEGDYSSVVGLPLAALFDLLPDILSWRLGELA
jgi:septum formation protein